MPALRENLLLCLQRGIWDKEMCFARLKRWPDTLPPYPNVIFTVTGILSILFSLAFKTRYTLPLLISAGFMVLDYQLTIEVEVEGNARDQPQPEERMARYASHYHFFPIFLAPSNKEKKFQIILASDVNIFFCFHAKKRQQSKVITRTRRSYSALLSTASAKDGRQ